MAQVKGLVLLSRFEYLENKAGFSVYREFLKKISSPEANFVRQPVDGANYYPENTLVTVDEVLLKDHFNNNVDEFRQLGEWNAGNLIAKYFNLYVDEQLPREFLEQFARLRDLLIGSGKMQVMAENDQTIMVIIDYGQSVPRSICLSEQGFITAGLKLCGAKKIELEEIACASEEGSLECKFKIKID